MHCTPSGTSSASTISRPRPCCSLGNVVSSARGHTGLARERIDGRAQRDLQLLGVEVLLEHLQLAAHPRIAHGTIERGHRVEHEALQALPHHQVGERVLKRRDVVRVEHRQDVALERRRQALARVAGARVGQRVQLLAGQRDDLARAHADVHQPLDRPQLPDFEHRVLTFAVLVAPRLGKTVTALPHAQYVLGQTCFPLHGADVQKESVMLERLVHCLGRRIDDGVQCGYSTDIAVLCPRQ